MRFTILTVVVLALLPLSGVLLAQDATPVAPAPLESVAAIPASAGAGLAMFEKNYTQWKKILTKLRTLRDDYNSASGAAQPKIKKQYNKLVKEGMELQPKLTKSAEKAYVESPKADPELEEFLKVVCFENFQMDDFEECYRVGKMLLDHGCKASKIQLACGVSAYCIGELDEADTLLKDLARKGQPLRLPKGKGYLDNMVGRFLGEPSTYKKAWAVEQEIRAKEAKADDLPRVQLKTAHGDIVIELFENEAPNTVANFISLVNKGFYDGLGFHRVLEGFMAQGGCPDGTGSGGPGYNIPCECFRKDARKHFRGSLSMAHAGKNTGGSQFFLTFVPTTSLDGRHTAFGRVVKGMDILPKIRRRDPSDPKASLAPSDKIIKAEVIRKRDHEYKPKKTGE